MENYNQQGRSGQQGQGGAGFAGGQQGAGGQFGNEQFRGFNQGQGMNMFQQMQGRGFDMPPDMMMQQRMQMQGMYGGMPPIQMDAEGRPINPSTGRPLQRGDPEEEVLLNMLAAKRRDGGDGFGGGGMPQQFNQFRPQMNMGMNIPAMQAMQHPGMFGMQGQMGNERLEPNRFMDTRGVPRPMELQGYFNQSEMQGGKKKRMHKKKPADMPRRPLSAYNLFFSEERERILKEIEEKEGGKNEDADDEPKKEEEEEGGETGEDGKPLPKVLQRPLVPAEKKRRPHRKTHGKISFQQLARMVGERWKALDEDRRKYYKELAQEDMKRQKAAMEEYYAKQNAKDEPDSGHLRPQDM